MSNRTLKQKTNAKKQCFCLQAVRRLFATANFHQRDVLDNRHKSEPNHLRVDLLRLVNCVRSFGKTNFVLKEIENRRFPRTLNIEKLCEYASKLSGNTITFTVKRYKADDSQKDRRAAA